MSRSCASRLLVAAAILISVSGCGSSSHSGGKAGQLCQDMLSNLTSLATVSTNIHTQQYATPADAVAAIAAVQSRVAVTSAAVVADKDKDLVVPFGAMLIAVQDFQTNVATQDATKQAQVQTELSQGDTDVRTACAKH